MHWLQVGRGTGPSRQSWIKNEPAPLSNPLSPSAFLLQVQQTSNQRSQPPDSTMRFAQKHPVSTAGLRPFRAHNTPFVTF